jgi:hypothetical protein
MHANSKATSLRIALVSPFICIHTAPSILLSSAQLYSYLSLSLTLSLNNLCTHLPNCFVSCFLLVPDDVVIDLVNERLSKPDCRLNGWILDGCPFNMKQIQLLRDLKIEPQKVIALEIQDETVFQELSSMKLHEASGKLFTP